jgi:hypothetical protein
MNALKERLKRELLAQGEAYIRNANETVFYNKETGVVESNIKGLNRYRYNSIDDFLKHEVDHKFVPHEISFYIGERDLDTGKITFNSAYLPDEMSVDESEDGTSVYSTFIKVDNP